MKKIIVYLFSFLCYFSSYAQVDTIKISVPIGHTYVNGTGITISNDTVYNKFSTGFGSSQTLYGGNTSGGSLFLSSTSNATKGLVQIGLGTNSLTYDETLGALNFNTSSQYALSVRTNSSTGAYFTMQASGTGAPGLITCQSGGTYTSPSATQSGSWLGLWSMRGFSTALTSWASAYIGGKATQNWTGSANGSQLLFATTPNGSTSAILRMIIDNNGDVKINSIQTGISSDSLLVVNGGTIKKRVSTAYLSPTDSTHPSLLKKNEKIDTSNLPITNIHTGRGVGHSNDSTLITQAHVYSQSSVATLTINADTTDIASLSAQTAGLTIANPTGTPLDGQQLTIRIKDNGSSQTISFGSQFRFSSDDTAPTSTSSGKWLYLYQIWNSIDSKWDVQRIKNNF